MKDNANAHPASEYHRNIRKSIPFYDQFHEAIISIVSSHTGAPTTWIDVGCGTGTLVQKAYEVFRTTKFILADPSAAMLDVAREKLGGKDRVAILKPIKAEQLNSDEPADVITAIQSLHYLDAGGRRRAVQNCHHLLRPGGMFITFENVY